MLKNINIHKNKYFERFQKLGIYSGKKAELFQFFMTVTCSKVKVFE